MVEPDSQNMSQGLRLWLSPPNQTTSTSNGASSRGNAFPLPKIPSLHMNWLLRASKLFWEEQQRCVAFVLFFEPHTKTWSFELPKQTSRSTESIWSLGAQFHEIARRRLIVGSFQSRPIAPLPFPGPVTPGFSGIHFVHYPDPDAVYMRAFLLREEAGEKEPLLIDPDDLIEEDYASTLLHYQQRLTFI